MTEHLTWLTYEDVRGIHAIQIQLYGGPHGLRNPGGLASAVARPLNARAYGGADIAELAAAYIWGICRNHPFVDGNKRTALVVAETFLVDNGFYVEANDVEFAQKIIDVAAGEIGEAELSSWLRERLIPATI